MNVTMIGTGYVGLVSGACFAEKGNNVYCVDIDEKKIDNLNKGIIPIYEPGLEELIQHDVKEDSITFTTDLKDALSNSEIIFISVGTPQDEDGSCDLKHVLGVADSIGKTFHEIDDGKYRVVVDKSTVPVGTADKVRAKIKENYKGDFDVISNPEFLKEGAALEDFRKPDRIVIGCDNDRSMEYMKQLYAPFGRTKDKIIQMGVRSAELTKYAANSMLATRISFSNEIANLCSKVGAKYDDVRIGMGSDSRIGQHFLFASMGYGGSCFPKDVRALINTGKEYGVNMDLIKTVDEVNERQKLIMIPKIKHHFDHELEGKTFGIWGLAFKPNTDDMREASSIRIINELLSHGASIKAYDPESMHEAKKIIDGHVNYVDSKYDAVSDVDGLVLITQWDEFSNPDFAEVSKRMNEKVIFDGRNIYNQKLLNELGFNYYSIGN